MRTGWNSTAITTAAVTVSTGPPTYPAAVPMPTTMVTYTAVSARDSNAYLTVLVMMTSIWYSRYLSIASVTMPGSTASGTTADTVSKTVISTSPPVVLGAASLAGPSSMETRSKAIAKASHLTCCRTSGPPVRKRVTSAATAMTSSNRDATVIAVSVPRSKLDQIGPREATASGFWNASDPPGAGMRTSRGVITNPVIPSTAKTAKTRPAGHQRGDGSLPSGKSKNVAMRMVNNGTKAHSANSPTSVAAGSVSG